MDPIPVTATATVMVALTPRGKPRPVVVDAETATRLVRAFADALAACVAGQKMLDDLAAVDAMEARDDTWVKAAPDDADDVVDATIYCGVRYFDGDAWQDCDQPAGHDGLHGDPALRGDGGELPAPASVPRACAVRTVHLPHEHRQGGAAFACDGRVGLPAFPAQDLCVTAGCGHLAASHWEVSEPEGARDGCSIAGCACRGYLASGDGTVTPERGPLPQALITLECGCSFTGPVTSVKKVYCDTHGRHERIARVTPYDHPADPDEPMPVSYLPLRRAALIGGGA